MSLKFVIFYVGSLLLLSTSPLILYSQEYFIKDLTSGYFNNIINSKDTGYIALGGISYEGLNNIFLLKINNKGDMSWSKSYGEIYNVIPNGIDTTQDKGYIVTGKAYSQDSTKSKIYVLKLNKFGNLEWAKKYGSELEYNSINLKSTNEGGYILSGGVKNIISGDYDIYILKLDYKGEIEWYKTYNGFNDDFSYSLCQTHDNEYIILGNIYVNKVFTDIFLIKLSSTGETKWSKTYFENNGRKGYKVIETIDQNIAITGCHTNMNGNFFMMLTDHNGNLLWSKSYGTNLEDCAFDLIQTKDGGFILGGSTYNYINNISLPYIIKINYEGKIDWTKNFDYKEFNNNISLAQFSDSIFYLITSDILVKCNISNAEQCYNNNVVTESSLVFPIELDYNLKGEFANNVVEASNTFLRPGTTLSNVCPLVPTIEIQTSEFISIFPNPANSYFTILVKNNSNNFKCVITDLIGHNMSLELTQSKTIINCENFPKGLYFISLTNKENHYTAKILVN